MAAGVGSLLADYLGVLIVSRIQLSPDLSYSHSTTSVTLIIIFTCFITYLCINFNFLTTLPTLHLTFHSLTNYVQRYHVCISFWNKHHKSLSLTLFRCLSDRPTYSNFSMTTFTQNDSTSLLLTYIFLLFDIEDCKLLDSRQVTCVTIQHHFM